MVMLYQVEGRVEQRGLRISATSAPSYFVYISYKDPRQPEASNASILANHSSNAVANTVSCVQTITFPCSMSIPKKSLLKYAQCQS